MITFVAPRMSQQDTKTRLRTLVLVGDTRLAATILQRLTCEKDVVIRHHMSLAECENDPQTSEATLVVALSAHWRPLFDRNVQQWCWTQGIPLLRVGIWQREAVIGPLVPTHSPGCVECAETRQFRAFIKDEKSEERFRVWSEDNAHSERMPDNPWGTDQAYTMVSLYAAMEIQTFLDRGQSAMDAHTVRFIHLQTLKNSCHHFLPYPMCKICAVQVPDNAEDAVLRLQPRVRQHAEQYRIRDITGELETLEGRYVDRLLGLQIVPSSGIRTTSAAFATTVAYYCEYPDVVQQLSSAGFAHTFRASRVTAIAEALERYSGFLPRKKYSTVYGSYGHLRDQALNPECLGLYTQEQYAQLSQASGSDYCVPYTSELQFPWVWGYSLREKRPILVPEQAIYYASSALRPKDEQFLCENSNGCAVGGSVEEAILHSLFEVIERDAFLLTWYGRLKLPAIDLRSTRSLSLRLSLERAERMTNFTFYAFDCTTDFKLPVMLVVGVNKLNEVPKMFYSAAAHWDPDHALSSAFYEVIAGIIGLGERFQREKEKGEELVRNSAGIQSIDDHLLAGAMPSAFSRVQFLFQDQPLQSMQERFEQHYQCPPNRDLTQDLTSLAERVFERGYDIIVVDQTSPELELSDLCCTRVLVPGVLPMTFGHGHRRTSGIERLYRLPQELGYTDHRLTPDEINPDPHAFP